MPATKSAERQIRLDQKKRLRNKSARTLAKTNTSKAQRIIATGALGPARAAVADAISSLDKATEKGIIHRNSTARRKSRLMKKLNAVSSPKAGSR